MNLGYGSREQDYRSSNIAWDYVSYWLIPKTWRSRLSLSCYRALRGGVRFLKAAFRPGEGGIIGHLFLRGAADRPHARLIPCVAD